MLSVPAKVRVFLCTRPTDMRKSFDGLHGLVLEVLKQDPLSQPGTGDKPMVGLRFHTEGFRDIPLHPREHRKGKGLASDLFSVFFPNLMKWNDETHFFI